MEQGGSTEPCKWFTLCHIFIFVAEAVDELALHCTAPGASTFICHQVSPLDHACGITLQVTFFSTLSAILVCHSLYIATAPLVCLCIPFYCFGCRHVLIVQVLRGTWPQMLTFLEGLRCWYCVLWFLSYP